MDRQPGQRILGAGGAVKQGRITDPVNLIASLGGAGFLPKAPGTWGTLVSLIIYVLLPYTWFNAVAGWWFTGAFVLICLFSVWISSLAEKRLGHDAPQIVIDEFCGFFVSVLWLPHGIMLGLWAFILFRAFDIAKPLWVNWAQKLPKGWGVVADDLAAGIFANLILQGLTRLAPQFFSL